MLNIQQVSAVLIVRGLLFVVFVVHFLGLPDGKGCARDPARAFVYFTKGAVAGDLISMKNLGIVYESMGEF
jgi:hypothetical protein